MTNKTIINGIDANTCEWRTGIEHCGDYECMLNKCCDLNCDWYERRKLEQLLQAKEQECEELKQWKKDAENLFKTQTDNADKIINRYKQALDEIEEFCTVYSDNHDTYETIYKHILDIINKAKEK